MQNKCLIYLSTSFLVMCSFLNAWVNNPADYEYLDQLSINASTDKSSLHHHYTKVYSNYFSGIRELPIKLLEIGIYRGDSVKMWEDYFPNADLHFIDITSKHINYHSSRSTYHFLDQASIEQLKGFSRKVKGDFDIIIDDGGHTMKQQINSFKILFSKVKSGGMYVIEDLSTSYWKQYGGYGSQSNPKSGPGTTTEFLKALVDDLNFTGAKTSCADQGKLNKEMLSTFNEYRKNIESIHFYSNLCIIHKR